MSRRAFLGLMGLGVGTLTVVGSETVRVRDESARVRDESARVREQRAVGYADVAAMLATTPFYLAHHGSSRSWPEMSMYGFDQSVLAGFRALEVSLARTKDGVWFGLHDATLDRTSGVTGKTANAMTWAEVQGYQIFGSTAADDPSQPSRPYMRWDELIAKYYPSHVLFVDPKSASGRRAELMAMMNALPGTPQDHLVCKAYGVSGDAGNTSGWAKDAADNGYHRWGYFYVADSAAIPTYQDRWDILGMEYTAPASVWTSMLAYGKPVIGHIVPSPAAVTTALGKGAAGLIISSAAALPKA